MFSLKAFLPFFKSRYAERKTTKSINLVMQNGKPPRVLTRPSLTIQCAIQQLSMRLISARKFRIKKLYQSWIKLLADLTVSNLKNKAVTEEYIAPSNKK